MTHGDTWGRDTWGRPLYIYILPGFAANRVIVKPISSAWSADIIKGVPRKSGCKCKHLKGVPRIFKGRPPNTPNTSLDNTAWVTIIVM